VAFCTRTINAASWQIHRQLDEAAYVSGISRLRAFRYVFLPMVAPALFYSAVMVGLLSVRELTLPRLMDAGKAPVVSTVGYNLQSNGNHDVAAAVAIYMIVILLGLVLVASRLAGVGFASAPALRVRRRLADEPASGPELGLIAPARAATPLQ